MLLDIFQICNALRDFVPLYNLKSVKNTQEGVLILVKLPAEASNFTNISTPSCMFFMFFKWYNGTKSSNASHIFKTAFY